MDIITIALSLGLTLSLVWWAVDHLLASATIMELKREVNDCKLELKGWGRRKR